MSFEWNRSTEANYGVDPNIGAGDEAFMDSSTAASTLSTTSKAGNIMGAGAFANMLSSLAGAYASSNAQRIQGEYANQQFQFNSQVAEIQASQALDSGQKQADQINREANQDIGSTRVSAAAGGIDVNSGSAADVQTSERVVSGMDILTAKNNAARAAFGYKMAAINDQSSGAMAQIQGNATSRSTLLAGGMNAAAFGAQGAYYTSGGPVKDDRKGW